MMKQDKFIWLKFKSQNVDKLMKNSKTRKIVEELNGKIFKVKL